MTVTDASAPPRPDAGTDGRPSPVRRLVRWLPAATVAVFALATLLWVDTAPVDILRYAAYAGWAVLLPGVLVYRALRRTPHSLVDDLTMGAILGLALEIAAFIAFTATGLRALLVVWPLLVVVPFAVVRPLRRHWRRPAGYRPAPVVWSWAVAAVAVFLQGYLTFAYLRPNRPVPTSGPRLYFNDEFYQLGLVGELKHHFPWQTPAVAGEPLAYHFYTFSHMATASLISRVDTAVVFFQLTLPALCLLAVLGLAVVGWRVSGRPAVGAIAAALTFAVGEVAVGSLSVQPFGAITGYVIWASHSVVFGALMTIPIIAYALDRMTGGLPDAPIGRGAWVALPLFAMGAAAGKASAVPVALAAAAMVALVELWRRRPTRTTWAIIGILAGALLVTMAVLFRFESLGMRIRPFGIFEDYLDGSWIDDPAVLLVLLAAYGLYMFPRLVGIAVLARIGVREWGVREWFLLGGVAGGALALLVLWHPSYSQNYFIRSAWPFGAILSAMGIVALAERHRITLRRGLLVTAGVGIVTAGLAAAWWLNGGGNTGPGYRITLPIFRLVGTVAALAVLVAAALLVARRRWPALRGWTAFVLVVFAVCAGWPSLAWDAKQYPNANAIYHTTVDPSQVNAARWLRTHSDPDDVIATNVHCTHPPPLACYSTAYWASAYSERRFLVESWGYAAPTHTATGSRYLRTPGALPFWDQDLFALNEAAFYQPDTGVLDAMRARGVRWLLADRRFGPESDRLATLARPVWQQDEVLIYGL